MISESLRFLSGSLPSHCRLFNDQWASIIFNSSILILLMPCLYMFVGSRNGKPVASGADHGILPGVPDMSAGSGGLAAQLKSLDGEAGDVAVKSKKKSEPNHDPLVDRHFP